MRRWMWLLPLVGAAAIAAYVILGHGPQTVPLAPAAQEHSETPPAQQAVPGAAVAARPRLPTIPVLPPGALAQETAADFERLAEEHPDEATATKNRVFDAFAEFDLHSCLPSFGLKGEITVELSVQADVTAQEGVFSDAKLVRQVSGMPLPPEFERCVTQRFGTHRVKAHPSEPLLPYRGEITHTLTMQVDQR
jgi:hypothetical protein